MSMLLSFALEKINCAQNMVKPKAGEKSLILHMKMLLLTWNKKNLKESKKLAKKCYHFQFQQIGLILHA